MKTPVLFRYLTPILCAAAVALLAGCGKEGTTATPASGNAAPAASGKTIHLAFLPKGMQHVYWKSVEKGYKQAVADAAKEGQTVEVDWQGPPNESDRSTQISVLENFIAQKVDGIILCPMDADALVAPVEKARENGIPVVIVDSPLNYKNMSDLVAFVGTNNEKAGEMAGEELAKLLNGKGNVILLRFLQGSASTEQREAGFLKVMAKYPNIKVLSSNVYGGDNADKCMTAALNLLDTFKNQGVDGVFAPNEPSVNGMLLALERTGQAGKIKFVGFDGGTANMAGLAKGEIDALVLQDPNMMGQMGVKVMLDKLAGKPVEATIDTGAVVLTKDNKNDPKVKDLLDRTVM